MRRRLAPIAEAATSPERRILLYTERAPRDAHLFQIIWYANRYCELLAGADEAIARLKSDPKAALIMDKEIFQKSVSGDPGVKLLGETEGFVCLAKSSQLQAVEARNEDDGVVRKR